MTDRPRLPQPNIPDDARMGAKDAARMLRQSVRLAGKGLLEPVAAPLRAASDALSAPLRQTLSEAARAADRFLDRTERGMRSVLRPGEIMGVPPFLPETLRAVLGGTASEQIGNALARQMRQWIKQSLALRGLASLVVLERPIVLAVRAVRLKRQAGAPSLADAATGLFFALRADSPVRLSTMVKRVRGGADPKEEMALVLAAVLVSMLAAAGRTGRAPVEAGSLIAAAQSLLGQEDLSEVSEQALAERFTEFAALL